MAVAALLVAIIAAIIATASGFYTRTQAMAARNTLAIERARHQDELTPRFEPSITSDGRGYVLRLKVLAGQRPMAGIKATIVQAIGVEFDMSRRSSDGSQPGSGHTATWSGLLAPGSQASWPIIVTRPGNSDEAVLEITDQADETRVAAVTIEIPPDATKTIW